MSEDPFLSRWSRKKRASDAEPPAPADDRPENEPPAIPDDPESVAVYLAQNELPEPETLGQGDDFGVFLRDGVPAALRRRALRCLWRSNPVLANVDGLVDYGDDFTDAAKVPDILATVYQVGKGMVKEVFDEDTETAIETEDQQVESDLGRRRQTVEAGRNPPEAANETQEVAEISEAYAPDLTPPRRMTFRFES
ncbi:MAG: DUF3306 domain-containing protein [Pseudomonadota bacterium]